MNVLEAIIGVTLTVTTATAGVITVNMNSDDANEATAAASVVADASMFGTSLHTEFDESDVPSTLTCATNPCTTFVEYPGIELSGDNDVTISNGGSFAFALTVTSADGTHTATYDATTGTVTEVGV